MKLIKNVSPIKAKVNLSVYKPTGELFSFELKYGESILVHDTSITARPIIIQKRKGHIDIFDDYENDMILYKINSFSDKKEEPKIEKIESKILAIPKSEPELEKNVIVENVTSETPVETKNKGGRPKGSFKKKGRGRPSKLKKSKKNKTTMTVVNPIDTNTDSISNLDDIK